VVFKCEDGRTIVPDGSTGNKKVSRSSNRQDVHIRRGDVRRASGDPITGQFQLPDEELNQGARYSPNLIINGSYTRPMSHTVFTVSAIKRKITCYQINKAIAAAKWRRLTRYLFQRESLGLCQFTAMASRAKYSRFV
jgi:hypothetical protein